MSTLREENLTGINHDAPHINDPLQYLTASSIMANKVYNKSDEKLGDVKDIMIDMATGKIEYVVIEYGGFLGIGEKFFAVPFRLLKLDTQNERFILDQSKEVLAKAPGFDKAHWPKTNSLMSSMCPLLIGVALWVGMLVADFDFWKANQLYAKSIAMEFHFVEEKSPHWSFKSLAKLVSDKSIFLFPAKDKNNQLRTTFISPSHYLKKIHLLFLCNTVSTN